MVIKDRARVWGRRHLTDNGEDIPETAYFNFRACFSFFFSREIIYDTLIKRNSILKTTILKSITLHP